MQRVQASRFVVDCLLLTKVMNKFAFNSLYSPKYDEQYVITWNKMAQHLTNLKSSRYHKK